MVDEDAVRSEARDIASDARKTRDLSDAEGEVLRDLLQSDDTFAHLVSAQKDAVAVADGYYDEDHRVERLAQEAATPLGEAIDHIIDDRIEDAEAIVGLSDQTPDVISPGIALHLYQEGYKHPVDLKAASQQTLVENGINRSLAARIKAEVGDLVEGEA